MKVRGEYRALAMLRAALSALLFAAIVPTSSAHASTYAVYIPLDSSIYRALDTLDGLGLLQSYLPEIKPITRVEAARLTLEAQSNLDSDHPNPLAAHLIHALRAQLREEIDWVDNDREDNLPTMIHPVQRLEAQYVYSSGTRRALDATGPLLKFTEGTPLLPYNDNLPTESGSNEVARWSGWTGLGGFITGYGEGAVAGPLIHDDPGANRLQLLTGAVVVGLGNTAISFGQEEMAWGVGMHGLLSQSNNAQPFPALRMQNIHPNHLPWIFRYLGLVRYQIIFGQLDADRTFARPWISLQQVSFKPLPNFEFGLNHTIMFGGTGNDNYSLAGFMGRATGLDTGNPSGANTNSRGDIYLKFRIPRLRNLVVYQEILGEDNLNDEIPEIGRFLPFLSVSYQGGVYLPELTGDGRTDAGFEYLITEPNYSTHSDSLYWTYQNMLMGNALGPNASRADIAVGRWFEDESKIDFDLFYTERAPEVRGINLTKEHSGGTEIDFWHLPVEINQFGSTLGEVRGTASGEYVENINYSTHSSLRLMLQLSVGFTPGWHSMVWH